MLLPYICPITMLQLRGGRAAVVGERCGGRRQQDVDGRSFDARWASGREVVCGEGLGCGLVGVDARMLQPVARAKRRTGGGQRRGGTGRVFLAKPGMADRVARCRWEGCQRGEKEEKRERKAHELPANAERKQTRKRDVFAAAGNGGDAQWAGGDCEWERRSLCVGGKHFAPPAGAGHPRAKIVSAFDPSQRR